MKKILTFILVAFTAITIVSCQKDPRPGKLVGDVTYRDRQIEGVEVSLNSDSGLYIFTTIKDGYFYYNELPPGDYILSCTYNGKPVASYLKNYEKSANPNKITILDGQIHTRNVMIPDDEDLGMDDDDE